MIQFMASEARQRHQFVDASLAQVFAGINHPEVQNALGNRFRDIASVLLSLYVPNQRHGVVSFKKDNSSIPVLALHGGEAIRVKNDYQTKQQLENTVQAARPFVTDVRPLVRMIEREAMHVKMPFTMSQKADASVISEYLRVKFNIDAVGKNHSRLVTLRPLMAVRLPDRGAYSQYVTAPSTLLHEATHIMQAIDNPFKRFDTLADVRDNRLRRELEAYHVQALVHAALVGVGLETGPNMSLLEIEEYRNDTNKGRKDPFYPNGTLRNLLVERDIDIADIRTDTDYSQQLY